MWNMSSSHIETMTRPTTSTLPLDKHNMSSSQIETMARPISSTLPLQGHTRLVLNGNFEDEMKHNDGSDIDFLSNSKYNGIQRRNSDLSTGSRALFE